MKENLISVVVPVWNVEQYLRKCLDSILNQTYKNFELILVNDGSPDKSAEIIREYEKKDSRITNTRRRASRYGVLIRYCSRIQYPLFRRRASGY